MRIQNNLNYEVHFAYAGTRAGWSIKPGAKGPKIPVSRLQDQFLRRDFMRGHIDIILDDGEEAYVGTMVAEGLKKPVGARQVFPDQISAPPQPTKGSIPEKLKKYTVDVLQEDKEEEAPEEAPEETPEETSENDEDNTEDTATEEVTKESEPSDEQEDPKPVKKKATRKRATRKKRTKKSITPKNEEETEKEPAGDDETPPDLSSIM
jgi:hypothetical protein